MPGRTGRSPPRSPHRPGRAQLRHPVPLVKVSLNTLHVHPFPLSVFVAFTCCFGFLCTLGFLSIRSASFPPTVLLPGAALPGVTSHPLYRSGFLRSRFPCCWYYDCATTAHRPSRSLRLCYSPGTGLVRSSFVSLSPPYPQSKGAARLIYYPPCPSAALYLQRH